MKHAGLGRGIVKDVDSCGDWAPGGTGCQYHCYYGPNGAGGQRMMEPRKSVSAQTTDPVLKEYVWGAGYVDELVQVGINQDPQNAYSKAQGGAYDNRCERFFWVCQDANYNVLGLINERGDLVERYEYTPYGQRTVYSRGGRVWLFADVTGDGEVTLSDTVEIISNYGDPDTDCLRCDLNGDGYIDSSDSDIVIAAENWQAQLDGDDLAPYPVLESFRHPSAADLGQVAGLCDIGHQGLLHDKEFGLIHNRARMLNPVAGRFLSRDREGYLEGMTLYEYARKGPTTRLDPRVSASIHNGWSAGDTVVVSPWGWGNDYGAGRLEWRNNEWHVRTWEGQIVSYRDMNEWADDAVSHNPAAFSDWARHADVRGTVYDITGALQSTARAFFKYWRGLSPYRQVRLCCVKYITWDIAELGKADKPGALHHEKVIVAGKVFIGAEVNYVLWGWLARVCLDPHVAGPMMTLWKAAHGFAGYRASHDWFDAGLRGWGKLGEDVPTPPSTDRSWPEGNVRRRRWGFTWHVGQNVGSSDEFVE